MTAPCFLVTGANGDIGDAIGRILQESYPEAKVHGADASGLWPGRALFHAMHILPPAASGDYPQALSALAKDIGATLVIPVSEPELACLADNRERLADVPLLMNDCAIVRRFLSKLETASWLESTGVGAPHTVPLEQATQGLLPLFVKPDRGWGSRELEAVTTPERLAIIQNERKEGAVAQTLLATEGNEFTCAVIRYNGETRTLTMRRNLVGGVSGRITVEHHPEIDHALYAIAEACDLSGVLNVQLCYTGDAPMVFEINPRFSSTVMMRHRLGFSDLCWLIEAAGGDGLPPFTPPIGRTVYRLSREVIDEE